MKKPLKEEKLSSSCHSFYCGYFIQSSYWIKDIDVYVIFESLARISLKPFDAQELSIALFFLSPIYNPQKCFNGSHNVYAKVRKAPPTKLELSHSIGGMLFPAISRPFYQHAWHYVASASAKIEAPGGHFTRDFLRLSTPDSSGS